MQRFAAKEGTHPGKLHTDTHARLSCLASKGKVGMENELITVIWMYFCVLNVLGHQKLSSSFALLFFFPLHVGGWTKEFFSHTTEKHFKFFHTAASWCFQIFFTAFLHCRYDFTRRYLPGCTPEAGSTERGGGEGCGKATWASSTRGARDREQRGT